MANTVFAKILRGEIPAELLHDDEHCIAFRDINPQAPVHVLVIPRKEIVSIESLEDGDAALLGHLMCVARDVARKEGVAEDGYRLVINNGAHAGQTVFHLHIHVLGGRTMGWPPG